jgi:hypothetical protein
MAKIEGFDDAAIWAVIWAQIRGIRPTRRFFTTYAKSPKSPENSGISSVPAGAVHEKYHRPGEHENGKFTAGYKLKRENWKPALASHSHCRFLRPAEPLDQNRLDIV